MLLQLGGATYRRFPLLVRFVTFTSANISETAKAGRGVSKEHDYKTEVDLCIGQVVSARFRHLPPISANDLFSRLFKALIIRNDRSFLFTFPQIRQKSLQIT
jgi:hypothetical protein